VCFIVIFPFYKVFVLAATVNPVFMLDEIDTTGHKDRFGKTLAAVKPDVPVAAS
jgi:hypothetical protein